MQQDHARTPDDSQVIHTAQTTTDTKRTRGAVVDCVAQFEQRRAEGVSQRQAARALGVPRTSLQHWIARKGKIDADPALIDFFESSVGVGFLHRLVTSAHVVFSFIGACGSRLVSRFLREAGLGPFVATSKGSAQNVAAQVESAIVAYGGEQRDLLGASMSPKIVTVCEDETFHPKPCLVAIEPVSNFILLERYDEKRDAATWNARMTQALKGLPVEVKQSTSDEAKGILNHVRQGLGAHHSPDIFHVQHALGGALARPLAQAASRADEALRVARADLAFLDVEHAHWQAKPRTRGRAPDFEGRRRMAQARVQGAQRNLEVAHQKQEQGRQVIRGVGNAYHPVDLVTGRLQSLPIIEAALNGHFDSARSLVDDGTLPQRACGGIEKAARVLPAMLGTLTFFFTEAVNTITGLGLDPVAREQATELLLPAIYLDIAAKKAKTAQERRRIATLAETIRRDAYAVAPNLSDAAVNQALLVCSLLFQRASSCVEGRNGQLALRHHCLHKISDRRLQALTAIHNYAIENEKGATAAERFFERKPTRSLFEHVRQHVTLPARPAARRPRPSPILTAA